MLFKEWAKTYLDLEEVKTLRVIQDRVAIVERHLFPSLVGRFSVRSDRQDVEAFEGDARNLTAIQRVCRLSTMITLHLSTV